MRTVALGLLGCLMAQADALRVVIDTDCGTDDLLAIAFLLAQPGVQIDAINSVHGVSHPDKGAENVRKLLAYAGRSDILVHTGLADPLKGKAKFPAAWVQQSDRLLDNLPPSQVARPALGAVAYYRSPAFGTQTVLALGPLTNLGAAFRAGVRFREILMMGGALHVPGNLDDARNKTAEWNLYADPAAAGLLFRSGARIRMVPLDATNHVPVDSQFLNQLRESAQTPLAKLAVRLLEANRQSIEEGTYYAWDPLAAVALVAPEVATWQQLRVATRNDGTTQEAERGSLVTAALKANPKLFYELYRRAGLRPAR